MNASIVYQIWERTERGFGDDKTLRLAELNQSTFQFFERFVNV